MMVKSCFPEFSTVTGISIISFLFVGAGPVAAQPAEQSDTDQTGIQWKGGPEFTSPDGNFSAKLRGRAVTDAWGVTSDTDDVDYPSGTDLRAGRLGIQGDLGPGFAYKFEADFSGDSTTVKDAYLQYEAENWAVTMGNQKPPFSLENITSLLRATFMERALPNVFAFTQTLGASVNTWGPRWTVAAGVFGETPDVSRDSDEAYSIVSRATYAPLLDERRTIHLGVSGYHQRLTDESGADFRVRQRPEVRVFSSRLADTGGLDAEGSSALALEFAGIWERYSLQGEYMRNRVELRNQPDVTFDGSYVQASWLLTGESRNYDARKGAIGRLRPNADFGAGGPGAVELAVRYSTLDLSDGLVRGGQEDNVTLSVGWYPTAYTRLAFNWVHFDANGNTAAMPFGSADHKGNAFGVRAQVDW